MSRLLEFLYSLLASRPAASQPHLTVLAMLKTGLILRHHKCFHLKYPKFKVTLNLLICRLQNSHLVSWPPMNLSKSQFERLKAWLQNQAPLELRPIALEFSHLGKLPDQLLIQIADHLPAPSAAAFSIS